MSFNTTFNSNLEHDPLAVRAAGFAPSVVAGYQARSKRHRVRLIFGLAGSQYTRSTDLNRIGEYFGASYRLSLGRWSIESEGEAILKGTNEDRETNDQYIATQNLGYRFDSKTRANIYYAYRVKRYIPQEADRNAVNPEVSMGTASTALPVRANREPCANIPVVFHQYEASFSSAKATSSLIGPLAAA